MYLHLYSDGHLIYLPKSKFFLKNPYWTLFEWEGAANIAKIPIFHPAGYNMWLFFCFSPTTQNNDRFEEKVEISKRIISVDVS